MNRQPPVARVGEFHVLDFVGAGGMGEVFRAVHSRTGLVAAVKFLTGGAEAAPQALAKWRERFIHEARVQESLRHPHLAAFYEWHEVGGIPCIVMELVDGQTLAALLQGGPLALPDALVVFKQVVEAVAFMHSRGVIHRDIKSGNVKINSRGEVKLLDFGIAKTSDTPRLTSTGAFVGTLQYLSPEQVRGASADARCDVWALGALLFEMLCGRPPFEAATWGELLEKVSRAQVPPLNPGVPRDVDALVRRCLQKQPQARFADATQLLGALNSLPLGSNDLAGTQSKAGLGSLAGALRWVTVRPSDPGLGGQTPRARSNVLVFAGLGAAGLFVLGMAWLLWSKPNAAQPNAAQPVAVQSNAAQPVAVDAQNSAANGVLDSGRGNSSSIRPLSAQAPGSEAGGWKTVTVDVFEGASDTRVLRDGEFVGHPPCALKARIGDTLDLRLVRPGFQDQPVSITVTSSRSLYSFSLERLAPSKD